MEGWGKGRIPRSLVPIFFIVRAFMNISFFKKAGGLLLAFLIIVAVINFAQLTKWIGIGGDNAQLMMLGKSIYQEHKYSLLNLPGEPAANLYPPLYPVVIASTLFLTQNTHLPNVVIPLKILNLCLFLAALAVFYLYLNQKVNSKYIIATIIILTGLSVQFSPYINEVLTEIPYLFLSILSVYCIDKYLASEFNKKYLYIGILFAILSFYTRTIGIALIASIILLLFFHKKYKEAIKSLLVAGLLIFPWFAYSSIFGSQPSYMEQLMIKNPYNMDEGNAHLSDLILRAANNAGYYASQIPQAIISLNLGSPIIYLPLLLIVLVGFLKISGKKIDLLRLYIPLYFLILLTWPWTESGRFLIPILPFLIYFFASGYNKIFFKKISQPFHSFYKLRAAQLVIFSSSMFLLLFIIINLALSQIYKIIDYAPNKNNVIINNELGDMANFIKKEIPTDGVIIFRKPYFTYFYTKRKSLNYPFTANKDAIKKYFRENNITHIIDDNSFDTTLLYLQPVIADLKQSGQVVLVYESKPSGMKIYKTNQ